MTGWAAYFCLGQVSPAYNAVDRHADSAAAPVALSETPGEGRESIVQFPDPQAVRTNTASFSLGSTDEGPSVGEGMISSESRMREIRTSG